VNKHHTEDSGKATRPVCRYIHQQKNKNTSYTIKKTLLKPYKLLKTMIERTLA
jgi:hypothetical protein